MCRQSALVVFFWFVAAILAVVTSDHPALTIGAIVACAYLYTRLCARNGGLSHALNVGMVWLVLAIVTEIAVTERSGRGWFALIGSPAHPLLRNVMLFVWIFAPALFARRETLRNH